MVAQLRSWDRSQRATLFGLIVMAALGVLTCLATVALAGTKTGAALGVLLTVGPVLLYIAIVSPIAFPFGLYAALTPLDALLSLPGFGTMTKVLGIVTAAAMLFYLIRTKRAVQPPTVAILWLLFLLWGTSTLWWAIDTDHSLNLLRISWSLLALFLVASMFRVDGRMLRGACNAVIAGGVLAAMYALYYFHSAHNLAQTGGRLWIQTDDGQIDPNHFANSFILPAALTLVAALWTTKLSARVFYIGTLLLMLATMALTGSRGGLVGFAAAAIFILIRDRHRVQLALLLGVAGVVGGAIAGPFLVNRFSTALSSGGAGRVGIWETGWAAFKENWLFGAGYANFPFAYDRAYLTVFQGLDTHFHRGAHNILLGAAVETGIIGVGLLLIAWLQTFRLLSPIREDDYRYPMKIAVQAAIVGLFVASMFVESMITKYIWLAFMLAVMIYNARPLAMPARNSIVVTREATNSA
jgi:O-antigen ligase